MPKRMFPFHVRKALCVALCFTLVASFAVLASACSCIPTDPIKQATDVIDNGISDITQNSEDWQSILQRVADDLPEGISEAVRVDAQNLATRAIATTGTEFRCNVDFLGNRAVQALQRLKATILNQNPPPLPPAFCQVSPDSIDLKVSPEHWSTASLYGYDLDHADSNGAKVKVMLLSPAGTSVLPEDRIGRTTHYQLTINLGNMARDLYTNRTSKIVVSWNNSTEGYPEIVVVPWEPKTKVETKPIGATGPYTPPRTGGDADFDTDDDEPTDVTVRGNILISATTVKTQVSMYAREREPDHTTVNGASAWSTAYEAPQGWQIDSVIPKVNSVNTSSVTTHGRTRYDRPGGEIVEYFEVWVDRSGDEAGTYTSVTAHWRTLTVTLRETTPSWLR